MSTPLGRPVADLDDFLAAPPEPALRAVPAAPAVPPPRRSQRTLWILAATVVVVAAAAGYWYLGRAAVDTTVTGAAPAAVPAVPPPGVGGFAELYLGAYLSGGAEDIAVFLPGGASTAAMTPAAHYVTRVAAIDVAADGDGYWRVMVAADVLQLEDDGYVPAGLHYYQVGVVDDGGRFVATALPARVAPPDPRAAPPRVLQIAAATPSDAQAALVGDFLEALLTGGRDIDRYTTPDSRIAAISPAPYVAIIVTDLAAYDSTRVRATVDAQESTGAISTMQYVLRFEDRGAGLAVAELLSGPPTIDERGDQE